jgi:hypothetical protein
MVAGLREAVEIEGGRDGKNAVRMLAGSETGEKSGDFSSPK